MIEAEPTIDGWGVPWCWKRCGSVGACPYYAPLGKLCVPAVQQMAKTIAKLKTAAAPKSSAKGWSG